jgi:hypothetical protein
MCSHDLFGCGSVALGKASLNAGAETESLRSATRQLSAVSQTAAIGTHDDGFYQRVAVGGKQGRVDRHDILMPFHSSDPDASSRQFLKRYASERQPLLLPVAGLGRQVPPIHSEFLP